MKKNLFLFFIFVFITDITFLLGNNNILPKRKAIIFGSTGQDGTYLTEYLLAQNYEVHGISRNPLKIVSSHFNSNSNYFFHMGDITNFSQIHQLIRTIQPDEIYNLAAQSQIKISYESPEETAEINALGTLNILEAIRMLGLKEKVKFFQASSSELFGKVGTPFQTEKTPFHPRSPYGTAKLYGYWISVNYRESYGIFACNGILFNHESPIRSESFVTRKITVAASKIKLGQQKILYLGNLDVKRDWGYAKDYVEAMWLMLQQDSADDYIIATGETHSVREFVELAFKYLEIDVEWHESGVNEYGIDRATGEVIVKVDPSFYRPNEIDFALGKAEKAEKVLHWKPQTTFQELVKIMIEEDFKKLSNTELKK